LGSSIATGEKQCLENAEKAGAHKTAWQMGAVSERAKNWRDGLEEKANKNIGIRGGGKTTSVQKKGLQQAMEKKSIGI